MRSADNEKGFSYVDVMIAMTILLVAVLSLGAAMTAALVRTKQSEGLLRAKQLGTSTLEGIFSARDITMNTDQYNFDNIRNVSEGGVFLDGEQPIYSSAGGDGIAGTEDDDGDSLDGFTRSIGITDIEDPNRPSPPNPITIRRIDVTISYNDQGVTRTTTLTSYVTDYVRK